MNSKWVMMTLLASGLAISATSLAATNTTTSSKDKTTAVATASAPININTADITSLETINGLGSTKAQAIIDYRTKNGKFATVQDLQNVQGIGPKLIEKIQSQITV